MFISPKPEDVIRMQFKVSYPLAKHPFGINRKKYKGRGRPREEDYVTKMWGSIGNGE